MSQASVPNVDVIARRLKTSLDKAKGMVSDLRQNNTRLQII